jgi:glycosyltransferase involved in cell wall biosynthesis
MEWRMKEYSVNKEKTVYDRSELAYQLSLASECAFSIPIGKEFEADYIDLFFNTFGTQMEGTLRVKIDFSDNTIPYEFPYSVITNEGPMRLTFGRKLKVSGFINVYLSAVYPPGSQTIAVWMNTDGPSMKLGSFEVEKISIKESPLISIITPVYKPEAGVFRAMLNSVTSQLYENWELILVDDGSNREYIVKALEKIADSRIKYYKRAKNEGICKASNFGISKAKGSYVCFLDHDDELTFDCLAEIVKTINTNPQVKFIYTDEDKMTYEGDRFDAHYKPGWSYHQLLSQNYICHLACYKKELLDQLGGFRDGYEGSQDYDLVLRASSKLEDSEVRHIPKILYHWKVVKRSTASGMDKKPYAHLSAVKALKDHLGKDYRVTVGRYIGTYRAQLSVPSDNKEIHIIIPTKDNLHHIETALHSVMQTHGYRFFVTIVDNGSKKRDVKKFLSDAVKKYDNLNVLRYERKFNFSDINNYAVSMHMHSPNDILVFLNDDTEIINPNWLYELEYPINRNGVAVTGGKLLYPNNTI